MGATGPEPPLDYLKAKVCFAPSFRPFQPLSEIANSTTSDRRHAFPEQARG